MFPRFAGFIKLLRIDIYGKPSDQLVEQLKRKARMLGNETVLGHGLHRGFVRFPIRRSTSHEQPPNGPMELPPELWYGGVKRPQYSLRPQVIARVMKRSVFCYISSGYDPPKMFRHDLHLLKCKVKVTTKTMKLSAQSTPAFPP